MKILVRGNAIEEYQMKKKIAKPVAREELASKMNAEKAKATGEWYKGRVDVADARKNWKALEKNYDNKRPESLDISTQNKLWKRAKQLKDMFTVGMLSRDELHPVKSFEVNGKINTIVDSERLRELDSVNRESKWQSKNEKYVSEYKNIMRHLNPDNPNAGDVEKFRPRRFGKQ